ncbi:NAD(P)/FAD-dependent oxidoreductase [Streptomyces cinnamoneus]|uniref:NAD(P)/FAD-dependent oxidoreductase n=1 Tax=Streptomyces cinnamoneus TaxID=53446 RepID=UPI0033ECBEF0
MPHDEDVHVAVPGAVLPPNPSLAALAVALKLVDEPKGDWFDVVIVGGGPAGLSAAVYAGTEGLKTLVIEDDVPGGQVGTTTDVANYLGFPDGISGFEIARRALAQAKKYKVCWQPAHQATELRIGDSKKPHEVVVSGAAESKYKAGAVVIASGLKGNTLDGVPGLEALLGRGVYYSALSVDAPETKGDRVAIVGGGNSAGQAALHFAQYAKDVNVWTKYNVTGVKADADKQLTGIELSGMETLDLQHLDARRLYLLLGSKPNVRHPAPGGLGSGPGSCGHRRTLPVHRQVPAPLPVVQARLTGPARPAPRPAPRSATRVREWVIAVKVTHHN